MKICEQCETLTRELEDAKARAEDLEGELQDFEYEETERKEEIRTLEGEIKEFEGLIPGSKSGDLFVDFKKYQEKVEELTDVLDRQGCTGEVRRIVDDLQFAQRRQWSRKYCEAIRSYMENKKDRARV